jgi:hypothetical protein
MSYSWTATGDSSDTTRPTFMSINQMIMAADSPSFDGSGEDRTSTSPQDAFEKRKKLLVKGSYVHHTPPNLRASDF